MELYEIVSNSERELHGKNASVITDPARRREMKIKQYKAEKEIRTRIEVKIHHILLEQLKTNNPSFPKNRPSPNDTAFPSHYQTPPRPTLTSLPRSSPPYLSPDLPPLVPSRSRTTRTRTRSDARRRFSYFGSPTHKRKHSSPASRKSSSCCALHHPRPRLGPRTAHPLRPRRSVLYGRSTR
jgi:hypothetical protein